MSHAVVIVALSEDDIKNNDNNIVMALTSQMFPFDENGECFRDGSRWDWYTVGGRWEGFFIGQDIIKKKDLDMNKYIEANKKDRIETYNKAIADEKNKKYIELMYGVREGESLEEYLNRKPICLSAFAFLQNRHWNEGERLGWFGGTMATECEIRNPDNPAIAVNKCMHKDEETEACIVVWNEPWELWSQNFYKRFIDPLNPETTLVAVDYHV